MQAVTEVPVPVNEPVVEYAAGGAARARLDRALDELAGGGLELTQTIGGRQEPGGGEPYDVVQPHRHGAVLGTLRSATRDDAERAIAAAGQAAPEWREMDFDDRAAVFLRAAELLTGPWRETLVAATMLGQSKTAYQAEIDAACELADFWRFNVHFARGLLAEQPISSPGVWNRTDHRPLEGFVYAITPFNFTAIGGNLPTSAALMGNVVLWKPAPAQQLAAHFTLRLLEEAGLPPGVVNMLTGDGRAVSEVALAHPDLAGIHFTGSTATFRRLWRDVGEAIGDYRAYPRLVGETGGKDFVLAHPSADPAVLTAALVRGAFEYQGQKCSAASRAFVPRSLWKVIKDELLAEVAALTVGDVRDPGTFMGAVIDRRAFDRLDAAVRRLKADPEVDVLAGGRTDDREGYFVHPTVLVGDDPGHEAFTTEYFGPLLAVHVYEDGAFGEVLSMIDRTSAYALTGSVIARDRAAVARACRELRFAAGNFYINDKPTGAVVGQQPFGGGRASGTNDKAGSAANLLRWTSARSIKETLIKIR
ncbi:L-glutamate gamma-semialdehyde dehydrogenase [Spirillospora sp. NPDC047279]|uniref:L-glutamate gamma-semialdehyde dehydrogenase n=1 Tax=Spirillospora sp. NPDC047279 TaxID=3155478 RepID=UPI0033D6E60C